MKHIFIVNPTSGVGKYQTVIDFVEQYFLDKEDSYEIRMTEYVGHATEIASEYDLSHALYSVGGDGTSHEVINGMQEGVSLGIIPVGTGNDFWRNYDLDLTLETIIEKTINGTVEKIDLGLVNGEKFLNCAHLGFDAQVNLEVNEFRAKWFPRIFMYGMFAIKGLLFKKTIKLDLTVDGIVSSYDALMATFMNGKYYGGGFKSAPRAELNDGLLEVCVVKNVSRTQIIRLLPIYYKGNHLEKPVLDYFRTDRVRVQSKEVMIFGVDGELIKGNDFEISIIKQALYLRKPIK